MSHRGIGLFIFVLCITGCASLEEPRWAMLGDTEDAAFFIDRKQIQRLPDGSYQYPVKIRPYRDGIPHEWDDSHETNRVLFVKMNCRDQQWNETGRGVMDQNNRILFRHLNLTQPAQPVKPETVHFVAYKYLCGKDSLAALHNH